MSSGSQSHDLSLHLPWNNSGLDTFLCTVFPLPRQFSLRLEDSDTAFYSAWDGQILLKPKVCLWMPSTYFPYFLLSKMLRPDLATLCSILFAPASREDFRPPWNYVLCSRKTQLSWLMTDLEKKVCQIPYSPLTIQKLCLYIPTNH